MNLRVRESWTLPPSGANLKNTTELVTLFLQDAASSPSRDERFEIEKYSGDDVVLDIISDQPSSDNLWTSTRRRDGLKHLENSRVISEDSCVMEGPTGRDGWLYEGVSYSAIKGSIWAHNLVWLGRGNYDHDGKLGL